MGTFGELELWNDMEKVFTCFTVEKPWLDNKAFYSCVPADIYTMEKHNGGKYKGVYAMVGSTVSHFRDKDFARSACLVHTANRARDVIGCIGLGEKFGAVYGEWAVLNSAQTVKEYCALLDDVDEQHTLEIQWTGYAKAR
jgi:hypothetical protein